MTENKYKKVTVSQLQKRNMEELRKYQEIGEVEKCSVAVERMKPLEPIRNDKCTCPKCGTHNEVIQKRRNTVAFDTVYCWHCGQAISVVP